MIMYRYSIFDYIASIFMYLLYQDIYVFIYYDLLRKIDIYINIDTK